MAERFGSTYSPQPAATTAGDRTAGDPEAIDLTAGEVQPEQATSGLHSSGAGPARRVGSPVLRARRSPAAARVTMLFLVPLPFLLFAFRGEPAELAARLAAFGLLILGAWLTRDGIAAQEAYAARKVARRPAIPRKLLGAFLTGAGLVAGGIAGGQPAVNLAIFALLGSGLHLLAFGLDPMADKGMEGLDPFQTERVAGVVAEAEAFLAAMQVAILRADDRDLEARVARFQTAAREMCRTVEADPRDLVSARRYLGVYLMGARDATIKFADLWSRGNDAPGRSSAARDPQIRRDYVALLDDLETNFSARTRRLLIDDRSDLAIEIDVLRERLQRDGLPTD